MARPGTDPKLLFDAAAEILDTTAEGVNMVAFGTIELSDCEHGAHVAPVSIAVQTWN